MHQETKILNAFHLLILSAVALFITAPAPAFAVTVGPGKLEYHTDPGAVINGTLVLINETAEKQTFWPSFEKFTEQNGEKKFLPSEPSELANWIKLPESVTLEPGQQNGVPFTITVPQKAPPGGHFAVIWWGAASPESNQVSIVTRAGILVFLQVSGDVNESGTLTSFAAGNRQFFFFQLPESFDVRFRNAGNTYLKPKGRLLLKNIFGRTVADFGINDGNRILLPDTEDGLRVAKKFDKAPFAFGLYQAQLSLNWGEKPETVQKTIWFFVFPWKQVLGGLIALVILFFGAKLGIKKYNQWVISKYAKRNPPLDGRGEEPKA
jgi:hypothetical protein